MTFEMIFAWAVLICQPSPTEQCQLWASECLMSEMETRNPDAAFEECAESYKPEDFGVTYE